MPLHRIEVLGPLRLLDADGQVVPIPGRRTPALLAFLAVESSGVERDTLARLVWPESEESARRQSLRQALSTVRRAAGIDLFTKGSRVALDPTVCESDVTEWEAALRAEDWRRALSLVRGRPLDGIHSSLSHDFEAWADHAETALLDQIGEVVQAEGHALSDSGDHAALESVLSLAGQAGLDPHILRAALGRGVEVLPPWVRTSVGDDALESLVHRLRPFGPPVVALVTEHSPGWCVRTIRSAAASLPEDGRPHVIVVDPAAAAKRSLPGEILATLVGAPGGAAVSKQTIDTLRSLPEGQRATSVHDSGAALESALVDAFDAVLEETPVALLIPAVSLDAGSAELLARTLHLQGGDGLVLVIYGREEHALDTTAIGTLAASCRVIQRICSRPPAGPSEAPRSSDPAMGGQARPGAPDAPHGPRQANGRLLVAGVVLLVVVAAGWALSSSRSPDVSALVPDHDILLCAAPNGTPWYFRYVPATGVMERFTADRAPLEPNALPGRPSCRIAPNWLQEGDSLFLAVQGDNGLEWRAYGNRSARQDQVGRTVWESDGRAFRFDSHGPYVLMQEDGNHGGVLLANLAARDVERLTGPDRPAELPWVGHDPPWWLLKGRSDLGDADLYRANQETHALERLTSSPQDEATGVLRGDSLLFARGRTGDDEDGGLELFLLDITTGAEERLTTNTWNDHDMRWSPDGRRICWTSEELGHFQSDIMLMDLATRRSWNLSRSPGRDFGCWFTPNGRAVLYSTLRTGSRKPFLQSLESDRGQFLPTPSGLVEFVGFVDRRE